MPQAFEGIRILDFTQVLAGPFAVMQLALLGADVIKVEQPGIGDQTRGLASGDGGSGMLPSFMAMNLNKQSITLNLKTDEARTIVQQLVRKSDVLIENFKAGTMERLGLGFEDLKPHKSDLIYCSVTGYGQTGPKAGEAAYDGAIQASSGMMSQTGHPETGPTRTGFMPVDMSTALNAAFAISAALYRRSTTGLGQRIDVAMMDTAIVMQAAQYSNYMNRGHLVGLLGNASPTGQPTAGVFPTRDGHIQISALGQIQVEKLFDALGQGAEFGNPNFNTAANRASHFALVSELMIDALKEKTTTQWMSQLAKAGIPVAEVRELPEVIQDPQFDHRGVFEQIDSPVQKDKSVTVVKAGYITDNDGPSIHRTPPHLGEHTADILQTLGYSADDIAALRGKGVT